MYVLTVFGDSITFGKGDSLEGGWCGRLKKYFENMGGNHRLYNLGISGNTTEDLLERFDIEAKARIKFKREGDRHIIIFSIGRISFWRISEYLISSNNPLLLSLKLNKHVPGSISTVSVILFVMSLAYLLSVVYVTSKRVDLIVFFLFMFI